MTYDWRPTATRSATADPSIVVPRPRHARTAAPARDAITVSAAVDEFVESAEAGRALNRSGRPYKPSALRDLRGILEYHVAQDLGDLPLRDVRREHVQALVDRLGADGLSESRIRSVISALRALYGYAIERAHVEFNPADGLVMPQADEPAPAGERDATSTWSDRLGEPWQNQLRWEDQPRRQDEPLREDRPVREDRPPSARGKPARDRETHQPMALLPERMLSLAMRAVFVLFVLIALVSVFESL